MIQTLIVYFYVAFILYKIKESISFEMRFINYLQFLKEMKSMAIAQLLILLI